MKSGESLARRLLEIESSGLGETQGRWSLKSYLNELESEEAKIFLWPRPETFQGFVLYRSHPDSELWIMNWACETKGQGQGLKLFQDFLADPFVQEHQRIGLEVRAANAAALKIYKKCGLELVGRRQNYYSNGEEALVFMGRLKNE